MVAKSKEKENVAVITPPNFKTAIFKILGISPYVQHKFSAKSRKEMMDKQAAGSQAQKKKKTHSARDFNADYEAAIHYSKKGWIGIPAPSFRNAMIRACSLVGFAMTQARMSIFVDADGIDADEGTPLVRIVGKPRKHESFARIAGNTTDIRIRPMWEEWSVDLRLTWDLDQFSVTDVTNLLMRAGQQVGIGEGRPGSKNSNGLGWGMFTIES